MDLAVDFLLEWGAVLDLVLVCGGCGGGGGQEVVREAVCGEGLGSRDLFGVFLHWFMRGS